MYVHVGRQPLLDRKMNTFAYELLYRSGSVNSYDGADDVSATATVLANTFLSIGYDQLLGPHLGFINFPRQLLVEDGESQLPASKVVIEILETVVPDADVVRGCLRLKRAGFLLALDDFVNSPSLEPLIELADFVKIDFRTTSIDERHALVGPLKHRGIRMIAEKVETHEELAEAQAAGYDFFQGYFFAKPQIVSVQDVPGNKLNYLRILRALQQTDLDFGELEDLIRCDISLVRKLLRYINSAAFTFPHRVESVRRAISLLGESDLRRWVSLLAISSLVAGKPPELVRISLCRARFCELVALRCEARRAPDCFLMGLFSLLDTMVGRPLGELTSELALAKDVRAALEREPAAGWLVSEIYELCQASETADPATLDGHSQSLGQSCKLVAETQLEAIRWSESVCLESGIH